MDLLVHPASNHVGSSPSKLKQEIVFLRQKIDYQQKLLESERKVTDDLLANKNRTIETLQLKLNHAETYQRNEQDSLNRKLAEVWRASRSLSHGPDLI